MKTVTLQSEVTGDGMLRLEVPTDLPPGKVEVVLVLQPEMSDSPALAGPPYPSLYGIWAGKLPDIDVEEDLKEMHDRLIASAAIRLGATRVTRDQNIQASQQVPCIW